MGMLDRLRDAHPDVIITAYDGHYCRISDDQMEILDHIKVRKDGKEDSCRAVEAMRRNKPKPKTIEKRLKTFIENFERA